MSSGEYNLKHCPFCGRQALIEEALNGMYLVRCTCCGCSSPPCHTRIDAICKWNNRADAYKSRWIPCEERLPKNNAPCLALCRTWSMTENTWASGTLMILHYLPNEQRWNIGGIAYVDGLSDMISMLSEGLLSHAGEFLQAAVDLLMAVVDAVPVLAEALLSSIPNLITDLVNALLDCYITVVRRSC